MTKNADQDRERRAVQDARGMPDSREIAAPDPQRWSGIVRCTWCGREVQDDWTPETEPEDRLCARCHAMVEDLEP